MSSPVRDGAHSGGYCVVLTACSSAEQADALCSALLDRHLAACVQVLDITSSYAWKGARRTEPEKLLLIKTRRDLYGSIEAALREVHPYEVPEIVCLPVAAGFAGYLAWIDDATERRPGQAVTRAAERSVGRHVPRRGGRD